MGNPGSCHSDMSQGCRGMGLQWSHIDGISGQARPAFFARAPSTYPEQSVALSLVEVSKGLRDALFACPPVRARNPGIRI